MDDVREDADAAFGKGVREYSTGSFLASEASFREALRLHETREGSDADQADCLMNIVVVSTDLGMLDAAIIAHERALELYRGCPDSEGDQADCVKNLGAAYAADGQFGEAEDAFRGAMRLYASASGRTTADARAGCWKNLGSVFAETGRLDQAAGAFEQALDLYRHRDGTDLDSVGCHVNLANVHALAGRLCEMNLGAVLAADDRLDTAVEAVQLALALYRDIEGTDIEQADCCRGIGAASVMSGRLDVAQSAFDTALEISTRLGRTQQKRSVEYNLAHLKVRQSEAANNVDAAQLLREAAAFAARSALDMDARRFQFSTESDRGVWMREVAAPRIHLASHLAASGDDAAVVADLIATSRAAGVLTLMADDDSAPLTTIDGLLADAPAYDVLLSEPLPQDGASPTLTAGATATTALGLDTLFRRRPPPRSAHAGRPHRPRRSHRSERRSPARHPLRLTSGDRYHLCPHTSERRPDPKEVIPWPASAHAPGARRRESTSTRPTPACRFPPAPSATDPGP